MHGRQQLTDEELAEIRRRRPGVMASQACEGITFDAEQKAFFEQLDRERLTPDERAARVVERAKLRQKVVAAE